MRPSLSSCTPTPGAEGVVNDVVPTGVETTDLPGFDAVAAYLTADEIDALAASDVVDLIVADNPVFGFDYATSLDVTNLSIGLDKVASPASGGPAGAGVGVAVIDSGVATTTDLGASRVTGWKDFVNKKKTPYDDAGHGTFVAGLIAGDGTASLPLEEGGYAEVQFRGVAPAADIIGLKVLDATGQGRASGILSAVAWAIKHKDEYNIRVINLSVGSNPVAPTEFDPIALAVESAWKAGITVVCAAGNEGEFGPGGILSPGNSPYVITVGASDTQQTGDPSDDTTTYYSSVGPTLWDEFAKPDLLAPGNRLYLPARARLLHRPDVPDQPDPGALLRADGPRPGSRLPHAVRYEHRRPRGRRRGRPHDRPGPGSLAGRRQGPHDGHSRPDPGRQPLPAGRRPDRRRRCTGE